MWRDYISEIESTMQLALNAANMRRVLLEGNDLSAAVHKAISDVRRSNGQLRKLARG
jgi:hypothetical protein